MTVASISQSSPSSTPMLKTSSKSASRRWSRPGRSTTSWAGRDAVAGRAVARRAIEVVAKVLMVMLASLLVGVMSRKHLRHSSSRVSGTPLRRRSNRMASGSWTHDTKVWVAPSSGTIRRSGVPARGCEHRGPECPPPDPRTYWRTLLSESCTAPRSDRTRVPSIRSASPSAGCSSTSYRFWNRPCDPHSSTPPPSRRPVISSG